MIPQSLKHSRPSLLLFSHDSGLPQVTLSGRYCGLGTALQVSHYPPPHLSLYRRPCAPWSARAALRPDTSPATDGSNSEIGLMLKTCSRPGVEKSGESVQEISTPGNLSRISRNPRKSETYRIRDRPLKKAEAMGQEVTGGRGGLHLNCQQRAAQVTFTLTNSPTTVSLSCTAPHAL